MGTRFLRYLLDANGGNVDRALASYYQGLRSVREHGMLDETRRFVANVKALRGRQSETIYRRSSRFYSTEWTVAPAAGHQEAGEAEQAGGDQDLVAHPVGRFPLDPLVEVLDGGRHGVVVEEVLGRLVDVEERGTGDAGQHAGAQAAGRAGEEGDGGQAGQPVALGDVQERLVGLRARGAGPSGGGSP